MISAAFALGSCSSDEEQELQAPKAPVENTEETRTAQFAEDDGTKALSGQPYIQAKNLVNKIPAEYISEMTDTLGRANITEEQYAEIQAFAQELTAGPDVQGSV